MSVRGNVEFYDLDAMISVRYRVNSLKATQFIGWAPSSLLKTFTIQEFLLDKKGWKLVHLLIRIILKSY